MPLSVVWTGYIQPSDARRVRVRWSGVGTVQIGNARLELPPQYGSSATATLPVDGTLQRVLITYAFDDGTRLGSPPTPPYAMLSIRFLNEHGGVVNPVLTAGPSTSRIASLLTRFSDVVLLGGAVFLAGFYLRITGTALRQLWRGERASGQVRARRFVFVAPAVLALAFLYHTGAAMHSKALNTERARADQSGYLWDAVAIYESRYGGPDILIGERNRMPIYPWLLSWLYDPAMSPNEFFETAKRWNIRWSMGFLAVFAVVAFRRLPPLIALNFFLVVTTGYYVFKAGYAQVELLFYLLFFLTFLVCWRLVRTETTRATLLYAALGGVLMAISHLSKASMLPLVAIVSLVLAVRAASPLVLRSSGAMHQRARTAMVRAAGLAVFLMCFTVVLWPYISTNKRVFGHYFYNVNSTFYVWHDDWSAASVGTMQHGDGRGWPTMPPDQIPSMRKYLREHTVGQIAGRFLSGFTEMVTVSYIRLWYFKFTTMYVLLALVMIVSGWRRLVRLVRAQPFVFLFLLLYGVGYAAAVAFYQPISTTSLRMLLAHVAPLLFVISRLSAHPSFSGLRWRVAGAEFGPMQAHVVLLITILLDMVFVVPWRLMDVFAGY